MRKKFIILLYVSLATLTGLMAVLLIVSTPKTGIASPTAASFMPDTRTGKAVYRTQKAFEIAESSGFKAAADYIDRGLYASLESPTNIYGGFRCAEGLAIPNTDGRESYRVSVQKQDADIIRLRVDTLTWTANVGESRGDFFYTDFASVTYDMVSEKITSFECL